MRALAIAIFVAMLGCAAVAQISDNRGQPQSPPVPPARADTIPQAPAGHRQPTERDLSPQIRHDETTGQGSADPLGPLPKICRNC